MLVAVLPAVILTWGTTAWGTGPALALALALPVIHAVWSRAASVAPSPFLPFVVLGALATASVGWFALSPVWFAAKEALLPVGIGLIFAVSDAFGRPLIVPLFERLVELGPIRPGLTVDQNAKIDGALRTLGRMWGGAIALSGVASGVLALAIVHSEAGTEAFNLELGRHTAWSWGVITLPTTLVTMFLLLRTVRRVEAVVGRPLT